MPAANLSFDNAGLQVMFPDWFQSPFPPLIPIGFVAPAVTVALCIKPIAPFVAGTFATTNCNVFAAAPGLGSNAAELAVRTRVPG